MTGSALDSPQPEQEIPLPKEYNLDVPFTSQAPHANWDHLHEEACEEASLIMVKKYYEGADSISADEAEQEIQKLVDWQNDNFGYFESTDAKQTIEMGEYYTDLNFEIVKNPASEQIKREIYNGNLVIVPAAGRELGNPYFTQPGPLYHMLVIKGYTQSQFITNDPGSKRGSDYPYDIDTILDANHDWNGGDVGQGEKAMIIVRSK